MKKPRRNLSNRTTTAGSSRTSPNGRTISDGTCHLWRLGSCRWVVFHHQRNARVRAAIERNVDRIKSRVVKLQLLYVDNEVARPEMHIIGQDYLDGQRGKIRHD